MKNYFFLIVAILSLTSCKDEFKLNSDKNITSVFTSEEINDIQKMIDFADKRVIDITGETEIKSAYKSFWEKVGKAQSLSEQIIPFKDEEKYEFLSSLNKNTFKAFFQYDTCFERVKYRDTILTNLCGIKCIELSYQGKYMTYLSETGKTNKRFEDLYQTLKLSGDIPAGAFQGFAHFYNDIDIELPEWRLLSTFYILRMEEPIVSKIDRYFEKNK